MGPKKPKKSKAELEEERLAREEEERKAKALEEKRLAEEREKKRQEELRIAAEQKSFREKELQRWAEEYNEIVDELRGKDQQLKAEEKMEESRLEWLSYKDPTDEPDASVESDMNTFISLTREAHVQDMKEAMEWIRKIEKVATAVEDAWSDSLAKHDERLKEKCYNNMVEMRSMIMEKVDEATIPLVRFAEKYLNDRQELNVEELATNVGIGLWGSLSDIRPIRKSVQLEKLGIQLDLPKQFLAHPEKNPEKYMCRLIKIPLVPYNMEAYRNTSIQSLPTVEDEDLKRAFAAKSKYVVGDMIQFDVLIPPPGAHHIRTKKWELRDRSHHSSTLRKIVYPVNVPSRMFIKVPDSVILTDDLRICVWNEHHKDWVEDGITDYQYSESTRMVQFYIATSGLIALVKKRFTDMPLRSWTLFPVLTKKIHEYMEYTAPNTQGSTSLSTEQLEKQGYIRPLNIVGNTPSTFEKHARLVLQTQTQEITIDFIDAKCYFVQPTTATFQDLLGKPFSPGCLLKRLQRKGINLLPILLDFQLNPECKVKREVIEREAIQQIASVANSMDISSSTEWNKTLNDSQVGILARESCVYTCPGEENEYECILAERDEVSITYQNTPELGFAPGADGIQYTLVLGNEYGKRSLFSAVPRPNEITHLELPRTLTQRITPEAMDRIRRINPRFQKTIFTFLSLIRPYSQT